MYSDYLILYVLTGNCILHDVASSNFQSNTAVLRFLLGYPCCHDMLLYKADGFRGDRNVLPVDLAKQNLVSETKSTCVIRICVLCLYVYSINLKNATIYVKSMGDTHYTTLYYTH